MSYRKLALNEDIVKFANSGLSIWENLADKWWYLDYLSCFRNVLRFAQQNMVSPVALPISNLHALVVSADHRNPGERQSESSTS